MNRPVTYFLAVIIPGEEHPTIFEFDNQGDREHAIKSLKNTFEGLSFAQAEYLETTKKEVA